jgi:ABC-type lipoprotein export system ATPase subunit
MGKSKKDPRIFKDQKGTALPGEVVAIMGTAGTSGCGKTSLLNVLRGRIISMNGTTVTK